MKVGLRSAQTAGIVGFGTFVVLTVLVQARVLAGIDLAMAHAAQTIGAGVFDVFSNAAALLLGFELSLVYAAAASLLLWRAGLGWWSLTPFAFIPVTVLELALKMLLYQPPVPSVFHRPTHYPFFALTLAGSFPSGHAIRSAFLCVFGAVLLAHRGRTADRVAAVGLVGLGILLCLSRVYLGEHWLSDVVAGGILGASLALAAGAPLARRFPATGGAPWTRRGRNPVVT